MSLNKYKNDGAIEFWNELFETGKINKGRLTRSTTIIWNEKKWKNEECDSQLHFSSVEFTFIPLKFYILKDAERAGVRVQLPILAAWD